MFEKQKGFSLIELMTVIAIIAILAAIATPNVITWYRNAQFNSAVREVKTTIEGVRMFSVKNNSPAEIEFPNSSNSLKDNNFQTKKWNRGTDTDNIQTHSLRTDINLSFSNSDPLKYNSRGMAAGAGTITIQNDSGLCWEIAISLVGSSRIQQCP